MKKILILGGTQFIGRNLVEQMLKTGKYNITLFNRGITAPKLFRGVKTIKGNRETDDIKKLAGKKWDCVIDMSGYYPDTLSALLDILKGRTERYIFISTISVYQLDNQPEGVIKENFDLLPCDEWQRTDHSIATYGNRKAECERVLLNATWLNSIILRPSLVYGKYDHTDRFYYWLYQAKHKIPVILPDNGAHKITLTYVNDLVSVIIKAISIKEHSTVYNVTTHQPFSVKTMVKALANPAITVNTEARKLLNMGVIPGHHIPLWFNSPLRISNARLKKDFNIAFTPYDKSIREISAYYKSLKWPRPRAGLDMNNHLGLVQELQSL